MQEVSGTRLRQAAAAADVLAGLDPAGAEAAELLELTVTLARISKLADGALVELAEQLQTPQGAALVGNTGWASAKDFLTHLLGGHKGAGPSLVRLAERTRKLPQVRKALITGDASTAQARTIATSVTKLPDIATGSGDEQESLRERAADQLLDQVRTHRLDAGDLAAAFPDVVKQLDPDGKLLADDRKKHYKERGAHAARYLSFTPDQHGGVKVTGYGSIEESELIKTALLPLAAPRPTEPGACGGDPALRGKKDPDGNPLDPGCPRTGCDHSGRDHRDHGTRMWDALVEAATQLAASEDLPQSHGTSARIHITIDWHDLSGRVRSHAGLAGEGPGLLPDGQTLSVHTVRRLACDAEILPAVLGKHGEILDLGRSQRLVTTALWNALVLRDRHCSFPGCTRLPIACDAHHIQHWADGGPTSLNNLTLVCRKHHTLVHHSPWSLTYDHTTGRPRWRSPPGAGPGITHHGWPRELQPDQTYRPPHPEPVTAAG